MRALKGAVDTIKRFRPKIAVCVYHRPCEDLYVIPKFLNELNLGYKFYFRPNDMRDVEMVLYAKI